MEKSLKDGLTVQDFPDVKQYFLKESKIFPTYPWNIPQTPNQEFMVRDSLKIWEFWGFMGYAPGVCWGSLRRKQQSQDNNHRWLFSLWLRWMCTFFTMVNHHFHQHLGKHVLTRMLWDVWLYFSSAMVLFFPNQLNPRNLQQDPLNGPLNLSI